MIPLVVFSPLLCSISFIPTLISHTFPSLILISFLSLSLCFGDWIANKHCVMVSVFYTQFNVYTSSSYQKYKKIYIILYVCTACCLLNEGAFFSGFSFWVFCVLWGWNILMSVFLFALYIFVLLLLFTVLWIYCEYIFNTISFGWLWYKFSYQKLLCRSFLNNRALPFFYMYIYFSF